MLEEVASLRGSGINGNNTEDKILASTGLTQIFC